MQCMAILFCYWAYLLESGRLRVQMLWYLIQTEVDLNLPGYFDLKVNVFFFFSLYRRLLLSKYYYFLEIFMVSLPSTFPLHVELLCLTIFTNLFQMCLFQICHFSIIHAAISVILHNSHIFLLHILSHCAFFTIFHTIIISVTWKCLSDLEVFSRC